MATTIVVAPSYSTTTSRTALALLRQPAGNKVQIDLQCPIDLEDTLRKNESLSYQQYRGDKRVWAYMSNQETMQRVQSRAHQVRLEPHQVYDGKTAAPGVLLASAPSARPRPLIQPGAYVMAAAPVVAAPPSLSECAAALDGSLTRLAAAAAATIGATTTTVAASADAATASAEVNSVDVAATEDTSADERYNRYTGELVATVALLERCGKHHDALVATLRGFGPVGAAMLVWLEKPTGLATVQCCDAADGVRCALHPAKSATSLLRVVALGRVYRKRVCATCAASLHAIWLLRFPEMLIDNEQALVDLLHTQFDDVDN